MKEAPPLVRQDHEDIENSKGGGRYHEEVRRDQLLRVRIQESTPRLRRWLSPTNHVLGHGSLGYFDTSLSSSPWIRGAPQSGLAQLILRINSRTSPSIAGLPGSPCRLFHCQYQRNPLRCQAITVSGFTISSAERHCDQRRESPTQSSRSAEFRRSRPRCDLFRTVSWWRRARISTCRAARDRNHDRMLRTAERRRVNMGRERLTRSPR